MNAFALVALGGGLGAGARYGLGEWLAPRVRRGRTGLPGEILIVNLLGSLLIGVLTGFLGRADGGAGASGIDAQRLRLLLATGFCGGFTTFSTATVGALDAARAQYRAAAIGYALANAIGCFGAVALGAAVGSALAA